LQIAIAMLDCYQSDTQSRGVKAVAIKVINKARKGANPAVSTKVAPAINKEAVAAVNNTVAPASAPKGEDASKAFLLRIPAELAHQVDQDLAGRQVRVPRNTWLLEAVVEKLSRQK
jgi:hypothetical protein